MGSGRFFYAFAALEVFIHSLWRKLVRVAACKAAVYVLNCRKMEGGAGMKPFWESMAQIRGMQLQAALASPVLLLVVLLLVFGVSGGELPPDSVRELHYARELDAGAATEIWVDGGEGQSMSCYYRTDKGTLAANGAAGRDAHVPDGGTVVYMPPGKGKDYITILRHDSEGVVAHGYRIKVTRREDGGWSLRAVMPGDHPEKIVFN